MAGGGPRRQERGWSTEELEGKLLTCTLPGPSCAKASLFEKASMDDEKAVTGKRWANRVSDKVARRSGESVIW